MTNQGQQNQGGRLGAAARGMKASTWKEFSTERRVARRVADVLAVRHQLASGLLPPIYTISWGMTASHICDARFSYRLATKEPPPAGHFLVHSRSDSHAFRAWWPSRAPNLFYAIAGGAPISVSTTGSNGAALPPNASGGAGAGPAG
jgi:hypothetical protein